MVNFLLFNDSKDIVKQFNEKLNDTLFICPSPEIADSIRAQLSREANSLTISKFVKDQLQKFKVDLKKKSEIYLELAKIWKIKFGDDIVAFEKAFLLFTELRSISINYQSFEDILPKYYKETTVSAIAFFWLYLEQSSIVDEHFSYVLLSEKYIDVNEDIYNGKDIVFFGFRHMSSSQIDLINSIKKNKVYISIPSSVFNNLKDRNDCWFNWITDFRVINISSNIELEYKFEILHFSKNKLCESFDTSDDKDINIYLCSKNISFEMYNELPFENKMSKVDFDYFQFSLNCLKSNLLYFFDDKALNLLLVLQYLKQKRDSSLQKEDFILYKVILEVEETFNFWAELSSLEIDLSKFDLDIVFNVVELNLPRVFLKKFNNNNDNNDNYNKSSDRVKIQVAKISSEIKKVQKNYIIASNDYSKFYNSSSLFNMSQKKDLQHIGILKSSQLEMEFSLFDIFNKLSHSKVTLLIEDGIEERDSFFIRFFNILNECRANISDAKTLVRTQKEMLDNEKISLMKKNIRLSPSKLQTYIDCPRKFAMTYLNRLSSRTEIDDYLFPYQFGEIEHLVVEKYFTQNIIGFASSYQNMITKCIHIYFEQKKLSQNQILFTRLKLEVFYYCRQCIEFLKELRTKLNLTFRFEYKVEDNKTSGRVDLVAFNETTYGVLDFKRSKASIPSTKQIVNKEKVQTWYYLSRYELMKTSFSGFFHGYINMSDISSSIFFTNDMSVLKYLQQNFTLDKKLFYDESLYLQIEEYKKLENETIIAIEQDTEYKSNASSKNCQYCTFKNICE